MLESLRFDLTKPTANNTNAYKTFYISYYKSQFFQNFITNFIANLEMQYEEQYDNDWNKNFPVEYFQYPFKLNKVNFMSSNYQDQLENLQSLKDAIKKKLHISQDYSFLMEQLAYLELIELFTTFEVYLSDIYKFLLITKPKLAIKNLRLTKDQQRYLFDEIITNEELNTEHLQEMLSKSINIHVKEYISREPMEKVVKNILNIITNDLSKYDTDLQTIETIRELRNTHIHNNGVRNDEYCCIRGLYGVNMFRGTILKLVDEIEEQVNEFLKYQV